MAMKEDTTLMPLWIFGMVTMLPIAIWWIWSSKTKDEFSTGLMMFFVGLTPMGALPAMIIWVCGLIWFLGKLSDAVFDAFKSKETE